MVRHFTKQRDSDEETRSAVFARVTTERLCNHLRPLHGPVLGNKCAGNSSSLQILLPRSRSAVATPLPVLSCSGNAAVSAMGSRVREAVNPSLMGLTALMLLPQCLRFRYHLVLQGDARAIQMVHLFTALV